MISEITTFFKRPDINNSRQTNIDYAKAMSIFFMVFIHVLMYPAYVGLKDTVFGRLADMYFGGFMAAPVFMAAMGVGLTYTRHDQPNQIIKRGVKFFIISFIVNIVRSLAILIYETATNRPNVGALYLYEIFNGDILGFVGLALILFGLLKKLKHHKIIIPSLALVFTIIITAVPPIYTDIDALGYTIGYIFPIGHTTIAGGAVDENLIAFFPLMSWFSVVAFGYIYGLVLHKIKNLDRFYLITAIVGLVLFVPILFTEVYCGYGEMNKDATELQAYLKTFPDLVMSIGFIMLNFSFWHFICKITPKKFNKFFFMVSNSINEIYIVSWVLIMNVGFMILNYAITGADEKVWVYVVTFALIIIASLFLGMAWKQLKIRHQEKKKIAKA